MISYPDVRNGSLVLAVLLAAGAATACGGAPKDQANDPGNMQAAAPACTSTDSTPVALAVLEYITTAVPTPQRYLSAYGTDSALPDDGFKVLQAKGPTYFWNDNPKSQQQVKDKLASVGPYATLLVVYRGREEPQPGQAVAVKLGGHYVGGEHDGKLATERRIEVRCDSTRWRVVGALKPAPKPPATAPVPAPAPAPKP